MAEVEPGGGAAGCAAGADESAGGVGSTEVDLGCGGEVDVGAEVLASTVGVATESGGGDDAAGGWDEVDGSGAGGSGWTAVVTEVMAEGRVRVFL